MTLCLDTTVDKNGRHECAMQPKMTKFVFSMSKTAIFNKRNITAENDYYQLFPTQEIRKLIEIQIWVQLYIYIYNLILQIE